MALRALLALTLLIPALACLPPLPAAPDGATSDVAGSDGGRSDLGVDPVTGQSCDSATTCGEGYDCYTLAPGGYCMPGAPGGPTACRDPEAPCPAGTVCSPLPMHAISGVCLRPCADDGDCRPGYRCDRVELWPGDTDSPVSAAPVCWTACEPGVDQMCNDDPTISSLHGTCQADGSCDCLDGFELNPDTGRCR